MIRNQTKGKVLAKEFQPCISLLSRMKGLMLSKSPRSLVMAFPKEQKIGIHMMFVFFPIDVLWLDANQMVVAMRESLKPWAAAYPQEPAKYVVELPQGTIRETHTEVGDRLVWS